MDDDQKVSQEWKPPGDCNREQLDEHKFRQLLSEEDEYFLAHAAFQQFWSVVRKRLIERLQQLGSLQNSRINLSNELHSNTSEPRDNCAIFMLRDIPSQGGVECWFKLLQVKLKNFPVWLDIYPSTSPTARFDLQLRTTLEFESALSTELAFLGFELTMVGSSSG